MKLMIPSKQLIIHNLKENEGDIDGDDDDNLIINMVSGAQATMVADQGLVNIPSIINLCIYIFFISWLFAFKFELVGGTKPRPIQEKILAQN